MNIVKIVGSKQLKDFLSLDSVDSDNTIIANVAGLGTNTFENLVPKSYTFYDYRVLIPATSIINIYYQEGISENYIEQCFRYWSRTDVLFFINEVVRRALIDDSNLVFVTSIEENDDFHIVDILCERIELLYGIKAVSFKKFKKGKKSKLSSDRDDIFEKADLLRAHLVKKLDVLDIKLPRTLLMRITKKNLKKFPKHLRAEFKQYIKEDKNE
jgi:hypothetical protein